MNANDIIIPNWLAWTFMIAGVLSFIAIIGIIAMILIDNHGRNKQ